LVDYEKGTPAWDIGQIMTRHPETCARRFELKRTGGTGMPSEHRLERALSIDCTCGRGDSTTEQSSLHPINRQEDSNEPTAV
jgi:hypothetical protein